MTLSYEALQPEDETMSLANRVADYLTTEGISYDLVSHSHTDTSLASARSAHVPETCVVKSVVLEDDQGTYVMAVIPANRRLKISMLNKMLDRNLGLATEDELGALFSDCDLGAVPPLGRMYGMDLVWDEKIGDLKDVYFEGGDHESLVHMTGSAFKTLMRNERYGEISG